MPPNDSDFATFGRNFYEALRQFPFGAMGKTDLEALLFYHLEAAAIIPRTLTDTEVANVLRITKTRARNLRLKASAQNITRATRQKDLLNWLRAELTEEHLTNWLQFAETNTQSTDLLPVLIKNGSIRQSLRDELEAINRITVQEKNPNLVWVRVADLSELIHTLDEHQPGDWDKAIGTRLKTLQAHLQQQADLEAMPLTLQEFATKDIENLPLAALRKVLNDAGGAALETMATKGVQTALMWPIIKAFLAVG